MPTKPKTVTVGRPKEVKTPVNEREAREVLLAMLKVIETSKAMSRFLKMFPLSVCEPPGVEVSGVELANAYDRALREMYATPKPRKRHVTRRDKPA